MINKILTKCDHCGTEYNNILPIGYCNHCHHYLIADHIKRKKEINSIKEDWDKACYDSYRMERDW